MRRSAPGWIIAATFLFHGGTLPAQSTLDALQQELNDAKQHHDDVTTQTLTNFFAQIDPAMASSDAAIALYQQAGGNLPDPSPVIKEQEHEDETETEKEARLARDQSNVARLGAALEMQCGLMHYAALFVVKPDQAGLHDQWVEWLKTAAQAYPQLTVQGGTSRLSSPPAKKPHHDDNGDQDPAPPPPPPPFNPTDEMGRAMKDTAIAKFLAFTAWNDKDQGGWSVRDVPKLYRANVLEPLRAKPTEATLAAWDAYIAMANADEPDNDRWNQEINPPLQFDRACDAYRVEPGTDKLEGLVNMIKANPTNPHVEDWITRVGQLMDDYRASHGGAPAAAQNAPNAPTTTTSPTSPNVTVTTVQQGDMTIITTHSNSAPVAPQVPH